jgi:single-strand DNA-binding protein
MLKAILVGNLGRDPEEPRYTPEGRAFTSFNVASNYRARGQDGEWEDRTEWVRVRVFGRLAEVAMQHLHKGSRIYVDGKLEARPYKHEQSGEIRAGLELLANDLQFMSPRSDDDSGGQSRATPPREQSGEAPQPTRASGNRPPARDEDLEDLPF